MTLASQLDEEEPCMLFRQRVPTNLDALGHAGSPGRLVLRHGGPGDHQRGRNPDPPRRALPAAVVTGDRDGGYVPGEG